MRREVDDERADRDRSAPDDATPASERRRNPGLELEQTHGLHDVLVRAELEPADLVFLLGLRGDHHDRQIRIARPELSSTS